jgi:hypothetical protein
MWERIFFTFLTVLTVATSGVLTYLGAMGTYRGIPLMQYVMMGLIAVYVVAVSFFWTKMYAFASLPEKLWRHHIGVLLLGGVMLVFVWFTSTYFNIISLSGMLVTDAQIQEKLDRLDFELISAMDGERRQMQKIQNRVLSLAQAAQSSADRELELDGRHQESARGPMFSAYLALGSQLALLADAFDEHARKMGAVLQEDTREAIEAFRASISTVRFFEARQEVVDQEAGRMRLAYARRRLEDADAKGNGIAAAGQGGMRLPDFVKSMVSDGGANAAEKKEEKPSRDRPEQTSTAGRPARGFVEELQEKASEIGGFLNLLVDTMRLGSPVVMWEVRDRYQELLTQSVRDLMTGVKSPDVHSAAVVTAIEIARQHLEAARERLRETARVSRLPAVLRARTEQQFIPFLKSTIAGLEEVNTLVNDERDVSFAAREPEFYRGLRLEPIDEAVWKAEYRSIPLIALAVLIDYILIPILVMKHVVARAEAFAERKAATGIKGR